MRYLKLKSELKELASTIRELKSHRKLNNRGDWSLSDLHYEIYLMKMKFRHKHIAYCLLRGKKYEQIEQPADNNKPYMSTVQKIMEQYYEEENVRIAS